MFNGSFLLMHNQHVVLVKSLLVYCPMSNANAPACKVIENNARVCLIKHQIVIIEHSVT